VYILHLGQPRRFLRRRPGDHAALPAKEVGVLTLRTPFLFRTSIHDETDRRILRYEAQIRIWDLATYKPILKIKPSVEDLDQVLRLLDVAPLGRIKLFMMKHEKPGGSPEVESLTHRLEMLPLNQMISLGEGVIDELIVGIVLFDERGHDGARLLECDVVVGVVNSRNTIIRTDYLECELLEIGMLDESILVPNAQLFKSNDHLII
jgi:hypothetical protein